MAINKVLNSGSLHSGEIDRGLCRKLIFREKMLIFSSLKLPDYQAKSVNSKDVS